MAFPIIINSSNYINNNTYKIDLSSTIDLNDYEVAVGQAYLYFSWFNINNNPLNNNSFQIIFPTASGPITTTVTLDAGAYNITDLNNALQYWFISMGYYLINSVTGQYTYYGAFQLSPTGYSVQWITNALPTSLPTGFTSGGMTFPASSNQHPQLIINGSTNFKDIIGFNAGTYPTNSTNIGVYTKQSDIPPNVSPISAVQMRLSCVYNPFSSNSQLIHVFTSQGQSIGEIINASPVQLQFIPCIGAHKTLTLQFYDNLGRVLDMLDRNIVIKLIFQKKKI
jgi:hypothetical protein